MILLDTCTLLWLTQAQQHLSKRARDAIASADRACVSAISSFEIALKVRKGKLTLPKPPVEWFELALKAHALECVPVSHRIAAQSALLPLHHHDPCDRIIVATAAVENGIIATPDPLIHQYQEARALW